MNSDKFKLKLFISVDLIGSSLLKNKIGEDKQYLWVEIVKDFYEQVSTLYIYLCREKFKNLIANNVIKPKDVKKYCTPIIWKILGDEIIFVVEIKTLYQLTTNIQALLEMIRIFRNTNNNKEKNIDIKSSLWLAGFPVINREYTFTNIVNGKKQNTLIDFLGPSMDIGFRLTKLSTAKKIILSIELVYMLCYTNIPGLEELPIYTNNKVTLKGVVREIPYPIFWMDSYNNQNNLEIFDNEIYKNKEVDRSKLIKYCDFYIKEVGDPLFFPFISGDPLFHINEEKIKERNINLRKFFYTKDLIKNIEHSVGINLKDHDNQISSKINNLDKSNKKKPRPSIHSD